VVDKIEECKVSLALLTFTLKFVMATFGLALALARLMRGRPSDKNFNTRTLGINGIK